MINIVLKRNYQKPPRISVPGNFVNQRLFSNKLILKKVKNNNSFKNYLFCVFLYINSTGGGVLLFDF